MLAGPTRTSFSNPLWEQLRDRETQLFSGAFAYTAQRYNLARGGEAQLVNGIMASGRFFDVLGVPAILGRTFTPDNDVRKGPGTENRQVAVISYAYWQRQYGGAADVLGKTIELDRIPFTIIGVTTPEFTGVDQGTSYEVAIPLAAEPLMRGEKESAMDQRSWWWMRVMARLKPGDTIDRAIAALPRRAAADARGDAAAELPPEGHPQLPEGSVQPARRGQRARTGSAASTRIRSTSSWPWSRWCCSSRAPTSRTCCSRAPMRGGTS